METYMIQTQKMVLIPYETYKIGNTKPINHLPKEEPSEQSKQQKPRKPSPQPKKGNIKWIQVK